MRKTGRAKHRLVCRHRTAVIGGYMLYACHVRVPCCAVARRARVPRGSHCIAACRVVPLPRRRPHARGRRLQVSTPPSGLALGLKCRAAAAFIGSSRPGAAGSRITGSCLWLQCRSDLQLHVQVNAICRCQAAANLRPPQQQQQWRVCILGDATCLMHSRGTGKACVPAATLHSVQMQALRLAASSLLPLCFTALRSL